MEPPSVIDKQYYLDIWREMLGAFLGWPEDRVLRWAQQSGHLEAMDNPNHIFYHETPQYWAMHLLIPDNLKASLSSKALNDLQKRIWVAFKDEYRYNFPRGMDWAPYVARVMDILAEYGATLPKSIHQ